MIIFLYLKKFIQLLKTLKKLVLITQGKRVKSINLTQSALVISEEDRKQAGPERKAGNEQLDQN
jgi:hypothetical protein